MAGINFYKNVIEFQARCNPSKKIYRKNKAGFSSFDRTIRGIELLKQYKVNFNTLTVVNNFSEGNEKNILVKKNLLCVKELKCIISTLSLL